MAVSDYGSQYVSATQATNAANAESANQLSELQPYADTAISDLNSGNYAGALQAGLSSGSIYGTNTDAQTTDPLLEALESSQGLEELDPSKQWNAQSIQQYYAAFGANPVTTGTQAGTAEAGESWGANPYGLWGNASKVASDAQTNIDTQGDNSAPDIERFAGSKPTTSFLGKYGVDIAALAATALSFGVAAPALAGALAADGIATGLAAGAIAGGVMGGVNALAVDAITGKPITAGGVLGGALGGAVGGGLLPLAGGAINDATGLGSTVSTGLAGAGLGAAKSALAGGNVGVGALTGGIGGAVQGSGILGNIKSGLTGAGLPSGVAGMVANTGVNYAVGGVTAAAAGALMGSPSGSVTPSNGSVLSQGAQGNINVSASPTSMQSALSGVNGGMETGVVGGAGSVNIGNNGTVSPTSTDSTLASAITGAIPSAVTAGVGAAGSLAAANAQVGADQSAITTQQSALGNINSIWGTQAQTGQGANTALQQSLGLNGQTADPSNFLNMPGYQFAVQQGTQAIQRQASSLGNAYTPNTAEAVGQYVTGTAAQDYNTYISQLMGAAGLGTTANQGLQTGQQTTANNISQLQQNQGQATAAGISGVTSAAGGLTSSAAGSSLIGAGVSALTGGGTNGSGVMNYGGQNPNGTSGNGTASDPYGANASVYNAANGPTSQDISNSTSGIGNIDSGFDPSTITTPDIGLGDTSDIFGNIYCDRRLKEAPSRLGVASNGLPLYEFAYKADPEKTMHRGYMADEVLEKFPDAVSVGRKGFLMVNYSKVPS